MFLFDLKYFQTIVNKNDGNTKNSEELFGDQQQQPLLGG